MRFPRSHSGGWLPAAVSQRPPHGQWAQRVALDSGVRALFAVPLQSGGIRIGVLLAHRDAPGPMDGGMLADLLVLAYAGT